jgi:hypothetical protein
MVFSLQQLEAKVYKRLLDLLNMRLVSRFQHNAQVAAVDI